MKNTLNVTNFINCALKLPISTSVLIRGDHGIGKSQISRQLAHQFGFSDDDYIDRRLSQMTEGDMIGLPSTDGNVTKFNPPDWIKSACVAPKFVLLDELNRATSEVMQASFQLVLDRELNGWKLHPQTRIYAAVNTSAQYVVNEMDPALVDRFWVVDLTPTVEEWTAWARAEKLTDTVVDFIVRHSTFLDPPAVAAAGQKTTSRRSWERFARTVVEAGVDGDANNPIFYQLAVGYLGTDAAAALVDFVKNNDLTVTPEQLLKSYDKCKPKFDKYGQERMQAFAEKLLAHLRDPEGKYVKDGVSKKQAEQIAKLYKSWQAPQFTHELRTIFTCGLLKGGMNEVKLIKSIHEVTKADLLEVFGVKPGEDGKGTKPTIPTFLNK